MHVPGLHGSMARYQGHGARIGSKLARCKHSQSTLGQGCFPLWEGRRNAALVGSTCRLATEIQWNLSELATDQARNIRPTPGMRTPVYIRFPNIPRHAQSSAQSIARGRHGASRTQRPVVLLDGRSSCSNTWPVAQSAPTPVHDVMSCSCRHQPSPVSKEESDDSPAVIIGESSVGRIPNYPFRRVNLLHISSQSSVRAPEWLSP